MSESPRSEKCQTRYSTPVPELDDHRFQAESLPRADTIESIAGRLPIPQVVTTQPEEPRDFHHVREALLDGSLKVRDFEHAIVDDDHSIQDLERAGGRRMSVSPAAVRTHRRTRTNQDASSISSSRSSSPPNSVDAFAEPRRRERANTLESQCPADLDALLHRTISAGTHHRRPTFSNESVIRADSVDPRVNMGEGGDVCFPPHEESRKSSLIDFEELEEFVALGKTASPPPNGSTRRKHSMSSQSKQPRIFHDLRPHAHKTDDPIPIMRGASPLESSSDFVDKTDRVAKQLGGAPVDAVDEKKLFEILQNENDPTRFSFFSSEFESTIHAAELGDLVLPGDSFRDLFQLGPEGGVWWLDVINPSKDELGAICRAFSIHPLTAEDIITQEAREKVELFKQYYFVCFRTFYQIDKASEHYLEPVNLYMVVFREGVLSFSFIDNPHAANVRKRIGKLREYVSLSSDWICYAMIDDIVDSFGPVIRDVERESEAIEDHVYVARVEDFNVFLPQIGGLRKKVMSLMRLLGGKADVIRGFSKRCNEQYSVTPRGDIGLYLGDIQDHVVTMMSNLGHFEKMLSRAHSNYLAQLNVTNIMLGNDVNRILSKITFLGSILVPLNLICGLFGMNVPVPGGEGGSLSWFFGILGVIGAIMVISVVLARRYKLL
ncbi:CorA-like Mg2+ transporter family protein [Coccidioides posadasii C735 delta SOWgp]|uniref:CorA-like Mg2+ transporter family protein n=1 Tax=Coccidioides posadasii (strain C735) TaxID=222929 RepID=C5P7N8_COCP7|nr:CorA-like Mg2+ transporter family protein [Coccidioides posadasii C735 delta SOWgp]EER27438.1 CorA-like Mg2+ transporter family protein [Coccidioides posadasii C735 delta SOWgp]|eukprot:XP_003069583.1 CorA-like Mg2+ transporter family protein [Coccidioides posadasii C735 delta SOWgp]